MFNSIDLHFGPFSFRPIDYLLMAISKDSLKWKKLNKPILSIKYPEQMLYDPFVVKYGKKFYLFYKFGSAADNTTGISTAISKDGFTWTNIQKILNTDSSSADFLLSPSFFFFDSKPIFSYIRQFKKENKSVVYFHSFDLERQSLGSLIKSLEFCGFITMVRPIVYKNNIYLYLSRKKGVSLLIFNTRWKVLNFFPNILTPLGPFGVFQNFHISIFGDIFRIYFAESPHPFSLENIFNKRFKMEIKSAISYDGLNFKREPGIRISVDSFYSTFGAHAPFVFRSNENYLMIYSGYLGHYLSKPFQKIKLFLNL